MTLAGKMALGLLALGITTYAVSEALARSSPKLPPPPAPPCVPPTRPGRPYAGSGWTGWPHKDVFPDLDALVQALRSLGYDVTGNVISARSMQEIGRFQADYNLWASMFGSPNLEITGLEAPAQPGSPIDVDQLLGTNSVNALHDAMVADQHFPGGWPELVAWYRARA